MNLKLLTCLCVFFLRSVRGVGNQYSSANGNQPRLDVLLLLCWNVYVLLRSLADLRVGDAALRHVSQPKLVFVLFV